MCASETLLGLGIHSQNPALPLVGLLLSWRMLQQKRLAFFCLARRVLWEDVVADIANETALVFKDSRKRESES
ncbi:MAG: hypothetical protein GXP26_05930 [Planctomycetes bacterium]|nr:hypothetical protein [Planctomycetota bacterium]